MEKPDTISVTVSRREEIEADKVDVHLTITGSSLVTGTAALKKAREVSQLVNALVETGLKEQDVALKGIHAESSSGILGRSTCASYQLRVRCDELERLADVLGVITSQKNVKLDSLGWRYPDDKKLKAEWLQSCLPEAKEKAHAIASSLGVKVLGVHALSETWLDSEQADRRFLQEPAVGAVMMKAMARPERIDLGFPLSHSKWVELHLDAHFRVSELVPQ
jgi:uncharacterized protein YggE